MSHNIIPKVKRMEFSRVAYLPHNQQRQKHKSRIKKTPDISHIPQHLWNGGGGGGRLTRNLALDIRTRSLGDIGAFFLSGVGEDLHCGGAVDSDLLEELEAGGEVVVVFYVGFCEAGEHDAEGGAVFDGLGACLALVWGGLGLGG